MGEKNIDTKSKPTPTPEESKRKDKIKTYIIYGVLIALIAIYLIYTALPSKNKSPDDTVTDIGNQTTSSDINTSTPVDNNYISTTIGNNNNNFLPSDENNESDSSDIPNTLYTIPSTEHVLLMADDDTAACYVYIPIGFTAAVYPRSILIKPEDFNTAVTGNKPMTLSWGSVAFFGKLKENKIYEDDCNNKYKSDTYKIIHEYDFIAHENALKHVYIIKHEQLVADAYKDNLNDSIMYTIVLDIENNGLYPCLRISNNDLKRFTTQRYPDLIALTEALFMPVSPDYADNNAQAAEQTDASSEASSEALDAVILPVTD